MTDVIKLEGQALEIARRLSEVYEQSAKDQEALQEEFARRLAELQAGAQMELGTLFPMLLAAAGLDRAEPQAWGLDNRYLPQFGLAFLIANDPASAALESALLAPARGRLN